MLYNGNVIGKLNEDTSGVWPVIATAHNRTMQVFDGATKRRVFPDTYRSLLHFDYPYQGYTGEGLRDEIGKLTWTAQGAPSFVGAEAPSPNTMTGTPMFGYRCYSSAGNTSYLTADNVDGVLDLDMSKRYEFGLHYRPTALTNANGCVLINLVDATGVTLLSAGHTAAGKLQITTGASLGSMNLEEADVSLANNVWYRLVLRIADGQVRLFENGLVKVYGNVNTAVKLQPAAIRLGRCIGQIDEFLFTASAGTGAPAIPTRPYAAMFSLKSVDGFGDGALGDVTISTSTSTFNTCAPVVNCDVEGTTVEIGTVRVGTYGGTFAPGQEVMVHVSQKRAGGPETDLGKYAIRRIKSVGTNTLTFDRPVLKEHHLPTTAQTCYVQVVGIPNFKTLTVATGATVTPYSWTDTLLCGGILAFKTTGNCTVNGKLIGASTGITREDTQMHIGHADMADRFIATGNVWIICGGTLTAQVDARIGNTYGGQGTSPGSVGFSGSSSLPGTWHYAGYGGSGGGNTTNTIDYSHPAHGRHSPYSAPNVFIVAESSNVHVNALSFGGGGGGGGGNNDGTVAGSSPGGAGGGGGAGGIAYLSYNGGGGGGGSGGNGAAATYGGQGGAGGGSGYGGQPGGPGSGDGGHLGFGGLGAGTGFCGVFTPSGGKLTPTSSVEPIRYDQGILVNDL